MSEQITPPERFPQIGTVEKPAYVCNGNTLLLAYEIAPVEDGGHAVLEFGGVIKFVQSPQTVEGARNPADRYPISCWGFTEITGGTETELWGALSPRFWTISFTDVTLAITFKTVRFIDRDMDADTPADALRRYEETLP